MSPTVLVAVQSTFSFVLAGLVAVWYVEPALRRRPLHAALVPLFLVHALRYLPSSAFAPGQIGADVPSLAMRVIAYGDLVSAILALVTALFLYYRWPGAIGVAWLVNTLMSLDWLNASYFAVKYELASYPMGGNWYIINYYVPMIGVVHALIFYQLIKRSTHAAIPGAL